MKCCLYFTFCSKVCFLAPNGASSTTLGKHRAHDGENTAVNYSLLHGRAAQQPNGRNVPFRFQRNPCARYRPTCSSIEGADFRSASPAERGEERLSGSGRRAGRRSLLKAGWSRVEPQW